MPLLATHQQRDLEVMLLQVLPQLLLLIGTSTSTRLPQLQTGSATKLIRLILLLALEEYPCRCSVSIESQKANERF